jgi:ADP-dependent NAD(P)H-hydrate dehydratase / NAD(P)H-hydrate epimerase
MNGKYCDSLPESNSKVNKYSRGRACVVAGSSRFPGAAILAAKSAARSGAGFVSAYVPSSIKPLCQATLPSLVVTPLPSTIDGFFAKGATDVVNLKKQNCVLYGPGTCAGKNQERLLKKVLSADATVVIDADMIEQLRHIEKSFGVEAIYSREKPLVLTPHHAELKKWLGDTSSDDYDFMEDDEIVTRIQERLNSINSQNTVVVAKGERTLVVTHEKVLEPECGTETLATPGTGDVLAGCICGIVSQKKPKSLKKVAKICAAAVEVHAFAGAIAGVQFGRRGALATDICDSIGLALDELNAQRENGIANSKSA